MLEMASVKISTKHKLFICLRLNLRKLLFDLKASIVKNHSLSKYNKDSVKKTYLILQNL